MKKIGKLGLLTVSLLALAACGGTSSQKNFHTVTFYSEDKPYAQIEVEDGKRIEQDIKDPTSSNPELKFNGWYKEQDIVNKWNFDLDIVTQDTSLYAGWKIVSENVTNIRESDEPFSSDIVWTQSGISQDSEIDVKLYSLVSESIVDGNVVSTYEEEGTSIDGSVKVEEDDVIFTPNVVPQGGKYKVGVIVDNKAEVFEEGIYLKGDGSEKNPFLVSNANDLNYIATGDGNKGENKYYRQVCNISYEADYTKSKNASFVGIYDGDDKEIVLSGNSGIFYQIGEAGIIKDLVIRGSISTASWPGIGSLANNNLGLIENVTSFTTVTSTSGAVADFENYLQGGAGGIVGVNQEKGRIVSSTFSGSSEGGSSVGVIKSSNGGGGIVGINYGSISYCVNKGCLGAYNSTESGKSLSTYSYNGGIAGYNFGTIEKSGTESIGKLLAQRSLTAESVQEHNNIAIGGVAGYNDTNATISECYFEGIRVHGDEAVGGIAGINAGKISSSYASGKYYSSTSIRSYIGGRVSVGGIAGKIENTSVIENCYNTANVFAYGENAYAIAEKATNSVAIKVNHDKNTANSIELGVNPVSLTLTQPSGTGNVVVDNTTLTSPSEDNFKLEEKYLSTLGDKFAYSTEEETIRLAFELEEIVKEHYKVNFYDGETLVNSLTVINDVTEVYEIPSYSKSGYDFVGWSLTLDGETLYEGGESVKYSDLTSYVNQENEINLYAKLNKIDVTESRLVIGYLSGLGIDSELVTSLVNEFEVYCETNSITIDNIITREYADSKIADYTQAVKDSNDVDILLGVGNNIDSSDSSVIKDLITEKVAMNIASNPGRYAISLSMGGNTDNASAFLTFLQTEEANAILNPEVRTDALVIGIFAKYVEESIANNLKTAFEAYLTEQGLTVTVTFITFDATSVADCVDQVLLSETPIDALLGGGGNINTTAGTTTGEKLDVNKTNVDISGSTRNIAVLNGCANTLNVATFIEFLALESTQTILNPQA